VVFFYKTKEKKKSDKIRKVGIIRRRRKERKMNIKGNKKTILAVVILTLMINMSCKVENTPEEENKEINGIKEASELFIELEEELDGKVTTRLHTNDKKYYGINGSTLWTVWGEEEDFKEREVKMSKAKGSAAAGYGLVICHGVREVEGKEEETMLVVMINNQGEYAIGKVIGGKYDSLVWWTKSGAIRGWAGAPNEIKISKEEEEFIVSGNGAEITRFVDAEEPRHTGGKNGYVVVISPQDRNTGNEVDVYFTEKKK